MEGFMESSIKKERIANCELRMVNVYCSLFAICYLLFANLAEAGGFARQTTAGPPPAETPFTLITKKLDSATSFNSLAEAGGFEPPVPFITGQRFSRPPH